MGILSPQSCSSSFLLFVSAAAFKAAVAEKYCKAWRDARAACSHRTEHSEESKPDMPDVHIFPLQLWLHIALETVVERTLFILSPPFFFNSLNSSSTSLLCCSSSCLIDASPSFSPLISERKQFYRHVFQKIFLHAAQACWLTVTRTPVSPRVASSLPVVGVHCGFHPPGSSRTRWYDRASRTKGRESECLLAFLWWLHGVLFLI